jgi:hypothetical protein
MTAPAWSYCVTGTHANSGDSKAAKNFYKVPVDRTLGDKLWAAHIMSGKSISQLVTEALLNFFNRDPAEASNLRTDPKWTPRQPRSKSTGDERQ